MLRKLAVYAGDEHPHIAQSPIPLELKGARRERDESSKAKEA
jgi:ribosomal protein L13